MNQTNTTKLFALPNCEKLGAKVSKKLGIPLTTIERTKFADGETLLVSSETVRSKDVYVIASNSKPVNDNILELLLFIDALKRASAKSINIVLTYYGYSRQDRKASGRQPIGARLMADLLETAGATKIIAVDLHNPSIQGFFSIPLDDLRGQYLFAPAIKKAGKFTVVSPDHGGATRARLLAELVSNSVQIAIVDKRRTAPNKSETMGVLGDVENKNVIIIDDMIDTGGTIIKAAQAMKEHGAKKVIIAATHGIFSKGFKDFDNSKAVDQVFVSDSISSVYDIKSPKVKVLSLDSMISKAISATINSESISEIYEEIRNNI